MILAATQELDLEAVALKHNIAPAFAIGLGAGVYFEYFRRPQPSPTHSITGLARDFERVLVSRLPPEPSESVNKIRAALRENALRFNLDRTPTTALMGMEMLAEELPQFDRISDYAICLQKMAEQILETRELYRSAYVDFLQECTMLVPQAYGFADELRGIAEEWNAFAGHLMQTAEDRSGLEHASRLMRRLAFREEHFWGTILEGIV